MNKADELRGEVDRIEKLESAETHLGQSAGRLRDMSPEEGDQPFQFAAPSLRHLNLSQMGNDEADGGKVGMADFTRIVITESFP